MDDDRVLVAAARLGDRGASERLFQRYGGLAYTTALRLLGDTAEAEDIAQESLFRAHLRLRELRDDGQFGPWLRRIAANLSVTRLRRRGRLRFESLDDPRPARDGRRPRREFVDERAGSAEERALELLDREDIQALLARLPVDQRTAVVLRDLYDYEMADVAALVRCGLSAAKMRVKRGRAALREAMNQRKESDR